MSRHFDRTVTISFQICAAFGHLVIPRLVVLICFTQGAAPHSNLTLRRLQFREYFDWKSSSDGAKKTLSFSLFSRNIIIWIEISFVHISSFVLASGCSSVSARLNNPQPLGPNPFPFSQEFRPPGS